MSMKFIVNLTGPPPCQACGSTEHGAITIGYASYACPKDVKIAEQVSLMTNEKPTGRLEHLLAFRPNPKDRELVDAITTGRRRFSVSMGVVPAKCSLCDEVPCEHKDKLMYVSLDAPSEPHT